MPPIRIDTFGGMQPSIDDRLLPERAAAYSRNTYLYSGGLVGWRTPKLLVDLTTPTTRRVYRIPADDERIEILDDSYWLEFNDRDTDVLKSPVIDDTHKRFYYASPSLPPRYNTVARIGTAQTPWLLGVPAPEDDPIVSPGGGSDEDIAQVRTYVYTYVTEYAEEGPPSNPLVVNGYSSDTWEVTMGTPDANDMGIDRNITKKRLYRTVVGSGGVATYFLVVEVDAVDTTYADDLTDADIVLNNQLESFNWIGPPEDLEGFIQAPNGMFVGWKGHEIWFCEPFRPHAWPSVYTLSTEFPIMGLAPVGQAIVVITKGYPAVVQGVNPNNMTMTAIKVPEPCISKGSIVSSPTGAFYMSPNGLIQVTAFGQASNLTENWVSSEKWAEFTPPHSVAALAWGGAYMAFGTVFVNPATFADDATYARMGFTLSLGSGSPDTKMSTMTAPASLNAISVPLTNPDIYNMFVDFWTSTPLLIQDQKVFYYDFADAAPRLMPYLWRSKIFQVPDKRNFAAMRAYFTVPANTTAQDATRTVTPTIATLEEDMYGIIRVYADGNLLTTRELRTSGELLRIASGRKCDFWQWEIEARVNVSSLQAGTSISELRNV